VHQIKDLNVSIALVGDFAGSHLTGDNSNIVPTDTQKNTVFAFAKEKPVGEIEQVLASGSRAISRTTFRLCRERVCRSRNTRGSESMSEGCRIRTLSCAPGPKGALRR